jgi:hypothetical protein
VNVVVTVTDAVSPTAIDAEAALRVRVASPTALTAKVVGAEAKVATPRADTTASATRLKNAFFDIYFLSIVDRETISWSARQRFLDFAS